MYMHADDLAVLSRHASFLQRQMNDANTLIAPKFTYYETNVAGIISPPNKHV
jgi:hypothetical protein